MKPKTPASARFWKHVVKSDGCWLWNGALNYCGYGRIAEGGRSCRRIITAHRLSWTIHNGPIPDGQCVLHSCDVRNCVNPAHLFLGTQADNNADMFTKERNNNIGPLGEAAPAAKLTIAEVQQILAERSSVALAQRFGISYRHMRQIKTGVRWQKALAKAS